MIREKTDQAISILKEKNVDMWLTFARESATAPDPMLEMILGTHCTWHSAFILTKSGRKIALVGSLDAQNIRDHADYEIKTYLGGIKKDLITVLEELNPESIAINYSTSDVMADGLSHGMYLHLTTLLSDTPFGQRFVSSESIVAALRGRKSPEEVRRIKAAIYETLTIFDEVTGFVRPGKTEKDVADFIMGRVHKKGLKPAWDPTHCPGVFTGPDSAGAHAGPTGRQIEPGHILNIDFGVRVEDYVSDLQRTWYFLKSGETDAPEPVQKGFRTIVEAIEKAADVLKPGIAGWEVDAVARQFILDSGYEEFPHGLGHQVGRMAHDGSALLCPRWERYQNTPYLKVEVGQVYTLEPRLTVDGCGIATIEEIVQVTETGCVFLSDPQKDLIMIKSV